ncbi:MAG: hypothetical protein AB8H79_06640 [Myxococcota bacterium]
MNRSEAGVWPGPFDSADPWAWRWPDDDYGLADAHASPWLEVVDSNSYERAVQALQDHLSAADRGEAPSSTPTLAALASACHVSAEWRTDTRPTPEPPRLMSAEEILRIGLDGQPDAGQRGPDALLGPWMQAVHPLRHRPLLVHAAAHWCLAGERSPTLAWTRSKPAPEHPERESARALVRAPLSLWSLTRSGEQWHATDRIGLHSHRVPNSAVTAQIAGVQPWTDRVDVLARAIRVQSQWTLWGAMALPTMIPDAVVRGLLTRLLVGHRIRDRRATVEDALRIRGPRFARGLWAHAYVQASSRAPSADGPR